MKQTKAAVTFRATVDRIEEGQWAVITTTGGGKMTLPVALFRGRIREGEIFKTTWRSDPKTEKRLRAEVSELQRELLARSKKR